MSDTPYEDSLAENLFWVTVILLIVLGMFIMLTIISRTWEAGATVACESVYGEDAIWLDDHDRCLPPGSL